jgi:hypothetical protein
MKKPPKRVLALPDLEHAKTAVMNSLRSASGLVQPFDGPTPLSDYTRYGIVGHGENVKVLTRPCVASQLVAAGRPAGSNS